MRGTPVDPVEPPPETDELLMPITLELSPIRQLLIIDITGDPTYCTLEPQVLRGGPGLDAVHMAVTVHDPT